MRQCVPPTADRGSVAVELVILSPVLIVVLLFVLALARMGQSMQQVRHAADEAARAASIVSPGRMTSVASATAFADLAGNGANCASVDVATHTALLTDASPATATVTVEVRCAVNTDELTVLGMSERWVVGRSTEVVDRFRAG